MTCDELRAYLGTTLVEDRTVQMCEQVEQHARICPPCAQYMAELAQVEQRLRSLPAIQAEAGMLEAVMTRITGEQRAAVTATQPASEMWRLPVLALSVLIAVAAWYRGASISEWFWGLWTVHVRLSGFGSIQQQPLLVTILGGIAALLAAAALLWHEPSEEMLAHDL